MEGYLPSPYGEGRKSPQTAAMSMGWGWMCKMNNVPVSFVGLGQWLKTSFGFGKIKSRVTRPSLYGKGRQSPQPLRCRWREVERAKMNNVPVSFVGLGQWLKT
jgi:hypothetical protein